METQGEILALLSDLHANLEALNACLEHARASGATRYAFLGDLVGYGADPQAVVELVQRHAAQGAVVVQGNHDAAVAQGAAGMNDEAARAIEWTRNALPDQAKAWLSSLPLCVREEQICFVHASAEAPERWRYIDDPAAAQKSAEAADRPYTFSGHVHDQALYFQAAPGRMASFAPRPGSPVPVARHRRWLAIAGSAGQPRDGNPAAAYALFEPLREILTFHRLPYDHLAAARKVRAAGLPDLTHWGRR